MKNTNKFFGIIALIAIIGFSFSIAACKSTKPGVAGGNGSGSSSGRSGGVDVDDDGTPGLVYESIANDTAWAVSAGEVTSGTVKVPASYQGKPVTNIANNAFQNRPGIISVTVGSNITNIGAHAFEGCTGLTFVVISPRVTHIGPYAFAGCTGLTTITIPASIISIGPFAFNGTGLRTVTFEGMPGNMGGSAFPGNLQYDYQSGGPGTYTRAQGSNAWAK